MKQKFLELVKRKARQDPQRIVFPEVFDDRTLPAAIKIVEEGTAKPILLGKQDSILADLKKL